MNTRNVSKDYRLANWAEVMNDRKESGLSIKAYCESAGLHENVYFYWQKKLREAACQQMMAQNQSNDIIKGITHSAPSGWIACEMHNNKPGDDALKIDIGQCRITVDARTDMDLLTKVCRTLTTI